jgi:hypothetical protein
MDAVSSRSGLLFAEVVGTMPVDELKTPEVAKPIHAKDRLYAKRLN